MDSILPTVIFLVVIATILYRLIFNKKSRVHERIRKVEEKKMGEVLENEIVRIKGKVVYSGKTLIAPFSKRKCVYFNVTVKDNNSKRDSFRNYINIDEDWASDVVLYDGEHYALIDTDVVQAYIIQDETQYSGFWNVSTPELEKFLAERGEKTTNFMGWSLNLIVEEGVLEEDEMVTVLGKASWRNASEFKIKAPSEKILYIQPFDETGVYLSEDPYV